MIISGIETWTPVSKCGERTTFALTIENLKHYRPSSDHSPDAALLDFIPFHRHTPNGLTPSEIHRFKKRIEQTYPQFSMRIPPVRLPSFGELPADAYPDVSLNPVWQFKAANSEILVSIIIPACNADAFLLNVVRHLANQSLDRRNYEIIIVDDGSDISAENELYGFCRYLTGVNIKYFYWPKRTPGIYRAGQSRNLGSYHAQGDYLVFLDSDMIAPPTFLEEVLRSLQKSDIVQFVRHHLPPKISDSAITFDVAARSATYVEEGRYWSNFFQSSDWSSLKSYWKYTCTYALAVKRSDFISMGGFPVNYTSYGFEDTDLGYRYHRSGKRFSLNKMILYHLTHSSARQTGLARRARLAQSAKIFYLNHLSEEIYTEFQYLLSEPLAHYWRLKARFQRYSRAASNWIRQRYAFQRNFLSK